SQGSRALVCFQMVSSSSTSPVRPAIALVSELACSVITSTMSWIVIFPSSLPCTLTTGMASRSRSEEHTSELQSRENLVCRLPLVLLPPSSRLFPYTTLFRSKPGEPCFGLLPNGVVLFKFTGKTGHCLSI